jgi:tRNA (adenine37-N6)-methyltransferase
MDERRLELSPIGFVRSPFKEKMQAPRQPNTPQAAAGSVELLPGRDFEHALEDLSSFRYVWLIFWFDQSEAVSGAECSRPVPRTGRTRSA